MKTMEEKERILNALEAGEMDGILKHLEAVEMENMKKEEEIKRMANAFTAIEEGRNV